MRGLRGGHVSGDKPYGELPRVSDRPAVGALPQGMESLHVNPVRPSSTPRDARPEDNDYDG